MLTNSFNAPVIECKCGYLFIQTPFGELFFGGHIRGKGSPFFEVTKGPGEVTLWLGSHKLELCKPIKSTTA